jgi:hypothetical protein
VKAESSDDSSDESSDGDEEQATPMQVSGQMVMACDIGLLIGGRAPARTRV